MGGECKHCGETLRAGAGFCAACGLPASREDKTPSPPTVKPDESIEVGDKSNPLGKLVLAGLLMLPGLFLIANDQVIFGTILLFMASFGMMVWTYQKPWKLSNLTLAIPVVTTLICGLIQWGLFSSLAPPFGYLFFAVLIGVGLGCFRGRTHKIIEQDGHLVAERSSVFLVAWSLTYIFTQVCGIVGRSAEVGFRIGLLTSAVSGAAIIANAIVISHGMKKIQTKPPFLALCILSILFLTSSDVQAQSFEERVLSKIDVAKYFVNSRTHNHGIRTTQKKAILEIRNVSQDSISGPHYDAWIQKISDLSNQNLLYTPTFSSQLQMSMESVGNQSVGYWIKSSQENFNGWIIFRKGDYEVAVHCFDYSKEFPSTHLKSRTRALAKEIAFQIPSAGTRSNTRYPPLRATSAAQPEVSHGVNVGEPDQKAIITATIIASIIAAIGGVIAAITSNLGGALTGAIQTLSDLISADRDDGGKTGSSNESNSGISRTTLVGSTNENPPEIAVQKDEAKSNGTTSREAGLKTSSSTEGFLSKRIKEVGIFGPPQPTPDPENLPSGHEDKSDTRKNRDLRERFHEAKKTEPEENISLRSSEAEEKTKPEFSQTWDIKKSIQDYFESVRVIDQFDTDDPPGELETEPPLDSTSLQDGKTVSSALESLRNTDTIIEALARATKQAEGDLGKSLQGLDEKARKILSNAKGEPWDDDSKRFVPKSGRSDLNRGIKNFENAVESTLGSSGLLEGLSSSQKREVTNRILAEFIATKAQRRPVNIEDVIAKALGGAEKSEIKAARFGDELPNQITGESQETNSSSTDSDASSDSRKPPASNNPSPLPVPRAARDEATQIADPPPETNSSSTYSASSNDSRKPPASNNPSPLPAPRAARDEATQIAELPPETNSSSTDSDASSDSRKPPASNNPSPLPVPRAAENRGDRGPDWAGNAPSNAVTNTESAGDFLHPVSEARNETDELSIPDSDTFEATGNEEGLVSAEGPEGEIDVFGVPTSGHGDTAIDAATTSNSDVSTPAQRNDLEKAKQLSTQQAEWNSAQDQLNDKKGELNHQQKELQRIKKLLDGLLGRKDSEKPEIQSQIKKAAAQHDNLSQRISGLREDIDDYTRYEREAREKIQQLGGRPERRKEIYDADVDAAAAENRRERWDRTLGETREDRAGRLDKEELERDQAEKAAKGRSDEERFDQLFEGIESALSERPVDAETDGLYQWLDEILESGDQAAAEDLWRVLRGVKQNAIDRNVRNAEKALKEAVRAGYGESAATFVRDVSKVAINATLTTASGGSAGLAQSVGSAFLGTGGIMAIDAISDSYQIKNGKIVVDLKKAKKGTARGALSAFNSLVGGFSRAGEAIKMGTKAFSAGAQSYADTYSKTKGNHNEATKTALSSVFFSGLGDVAGKYTGQFKQELSKSNFPEIGDVAEKRLTRSQWMAAAIDKATSIGISTAEDVIVKKQPVSLSGIVYKEFTGLIGKGIASKVTLPKPHLDISLEESAQNAIQRLSASEEILSRETATRDRLKRLTQLSPGDSNLNKELANSESRVKRAQARRDTHLQESKAPIEAIRLQKQRETETEQNSALKRLIEAQRNQKRAEQEMAVLGESYGVDIVRHPEGGENSIRVTNPDGSPASDAVAREVRRKLSESREFQEAYRESNNQHPDNSEPAPKTRKFFDAHEKALRELEKSQKEYEEATAKIVENPGDSNAIEAEETARSKMIATANRERAAAKDLSDFQDRLRIARHGTVPEGSSSDYIATEEVPDTRGYTRQSQNWLQVAADDQLVDIYARPTTPHAAKLLEDGAALAKPEMLKNKTINELDVTLGMDSNNLGKVGHFQPKLPPRESVSDQNYDQLTRRFEQRNQEYQDQKKYLEKLESEGKIEIRDSLIIDAQTGLPFTGDIDIFDVRGKDGEPLPRAIREGVMNNLQGNPGAMLPGDGGSVRHGSQMDWDRSNLSTEAPAGERSKREIADEIDQRIRESHQADGEALVKFSGETETSNQSAAYYNPDDDDSNDETQESERDQ